MLREYKNTLVYIQVTSVERERESDYIDCSKSQRPVLPTPTSVKGIQQNGPDIQETQRSWLSLLTTKTNAVKIIYHYFF